MEGELLLLLLLMLLIWVRQITSPVDSDRADTWPWEDTPYREVASKSASVGAPPAVWSAKSNSFAWSEKIPLVTRGLRATRSVDRTNRIIGV